ncbi:MAG: hypothetical protein AAF483_07510 [Planctomycetota bacterium]
MQRKWVGHQRLSILHVLWCQRFLPSRSQHVADRLGAPAVGTFSWDEEREWLELFDRIIASDNWDSAVESVKGDERIHAELMASLSEAEEAFKEAFPNFESEIQLRIGPLLQIWEAQGPGLLLQLRELLRFDRLDETQVFLLQPVLGGFGRAHPPNDAVQFEAVLANEDPRLPESLRVAWLFAQVALGKIVGAQTTTVSLRLACLPAVLQAGEELGVTMYRPEVLEAACSHWMPESSLSGDTIEKLMPLWEEACSQEQAGTRMKEQVLALGIDEP